MNHKPLQFVEYATDGEAVADDLAFERALEFVKSNRTHWKVSTFNVISYLRILIFREVISHNDVLFQYKDKMLHANSDARFEVWPFGWGDHDEYILSELIRPKNKCQKHI